MVFKPHIQLEIMTKFGKDILKETFKYQRADMANVMGWNVSAPDSNVEDLVTNNSGCDFIWRQDHHG